VPSGSREHVLTGQFVGRPRRVAPVDQPMLMRQDGGVNLVANPDGIIAELQWRGLIAQSTDLEALTKACANPVTLYCGFDPTAPSLHLGNLVQILTVRRFQQ